MTFMRHSFRVYGVAFAALLATFSAGSLHAQALPAKVAITAVNTAPSADDLVLDIRLVLRDAAGNPLPADPSLLAREGEVELLSPNAREPVPAEIIPAATPLDLLLLIDTSTSMAGVIDQVRAAAARAVELAPHDAEIAIYTFNDVPPDQPFLPLQDFTSDHESVAGALGTIGVPPSAPTCLYNAVYRAAQAFAERPAARNRRAIVLFTDGRDTRTLDGSVPCSDRSVDDAITIAGQGLPVHTIGLCADASCTNIDGGTLAHIASSTGGQSATGHNDEIEQLFLRVMDGINGEWIARANVCPAAGTNEALLHVRLAAGGEALADNFSFSSEAACTTGPLTPTVRIAQVNDDDLREQYQVRLELRRPDLLSSLDVEVWDDARHVRLPDAGTTDILAIAQPSDVLSGIYTITFTQPADLFEADVDYCLRVNSYDLRSQLLTDAEGNPIEHCFKHQPGFNVAITALDPRWDINKLQIGVQMEGVGSDAPVFDGKITTSSGQTLLDFVNLVPADGLIIVDIPEALRRATGGAELTVQLTTHHRGTTHTSSSKFTVTPPSRFPDLTLWLLGAGLLIALALTAVVLVATRTAGRPTRNPEPYSGNEPNPPKLRIRLQATPDQQQRVGDQTVNSFPCSIGRGDWSTYAVKGDAGISHDHAVISVIDGDLFVTDLNSINGTFYGDQQLKPGEPRRLIGKVRLRLGPHTILEVEPLD